MNRRGIQWERALDFTRAEKNLRGEMPGDWHQDPWSWPELNYLVRKEPQLLVQHCNSTGALEAALLDVPKENWGTRPAVVLDTTDRLVYQALVDRVSLDLIGDLSPNVFGWRLPAVDPEAGVYSHNNKQWDGYAGHLSWLGAIYEVALRSDLVSFFASVPLQPLQEAIQDRTPKGAVTNRLCDLLDGFQDTPDRSGLPQRSSASAVLANMYLRPLDDLLKHHAEDRQALFGSKVRYQSFARWMDDIWLMVQDPAAARCAQVALQSTARAIGLNLNDAKTEVLEGADVADQALSIEHSAVDDSIDTRRDFKPLEELIDGILDRPEKAGRPTARFVATRMREHDHRFRVDDILSLANRMPHLADAWSRLFKAVYKQPGLQDWYLDYASGDWATFEWTVAHYGRMFPSSRKPRRALREFFADTVRDANTSLTLLTVAAQRLCAWDPDEGRAACRDAHRRAGTPHARRVLALSALGVGERRTTVRRWLGADKENYPTLRMLEEYSFNPPKVQTDFAE